MGILEILGLGAARADSEDSRRGQTATVRKIVDTLRQTPTAQARYLACFAYVLGRVAHADLQISDDETTAMERLVMQHSGLPEAEAIIVVQMAKSQNELFGGTENFLVTREFGETATREQKFSLLGCLFAVASSDESISAQEDREIRKIAGELLLDHKDFISARSRYLAYLEVLKNNR